MIPVTNSKLPSLGYPLSVVWSIDALGYPNMTPVEINDRIIAASENRLLGIDLNSGEILWTREYGSHIVNFAGLGVAAVVSVDNEEGYSQIEAINADGGVVWHYNGDWDCGSDALRGAGDKLLALGRHRGAGMEQSCRVLKADDGTLENELPVHGMCPYLTDVGLVFGCNVAQPGDLGLFRMNWNGSKQRLHDAPAKIVNVHGNMAVFSNFELGRVGGDLIALDLSNDRELWRVASGPASSLPLSGGQVATVRSIDEERIVACMYEFETGRICWEAEPVEGMMATLTLSEDILLVCVNASHFYLYRRDDGKQIQELDMGSGLVEGLCATHFGVINSYRGRIQCLRTENNKIKYEPR